MRYKGDIVAFDDTQPNGWWYAIAFAMDKKIPSPMYEIAKDSL